jgi:hypothetical protein
VRRDAAQGPFGGIVVEAEATVVEAAREDVDALEHIVHGLRHFVLARELPRSRFIQSMRSFTSGTTSLRRAATRASGDEPLIERSSMKMASNF